MITIKPSQTMETWQKCPVCYGYGTVFGQLTQNVMCHTCNGHGIISTISGYPPEGVRDLFGTTTTGETIFNPTNQND